MDKKNLKTIAKYCLIGGIVLCAFAQIVPWGEIDITPSGSVIFYSWGMQASSSSFNELGLYFRFLTDLNSTKYFGEGEYSNILIPIIFSTLVMPLCILAIVLGAVDYFYLTQKKIRVGLMSGIISVISIVFFYLFIQFGIISINAMISSYYQWSTGFYLMIFSAILFFSAHIITGIGTDN